MSNMIDPAMLGVLPTGGYFSLVKILVMIVLLLPWLYACTWVHRDTKAVHVSQVGWPSAVLGAGAAGVLLWLLIPIYAVGTLLYMALAYGSCISYVVMRNRKVIPSARVLTSEHIASLFKSKKSQIVGIVQRLKIYDALGRPVLPPTEDQPSECQTYNLTQDFLHSVVIFRASQADMVAGGDQAVVRFIVDGVLQKRPPLEPADAEGVINYIKDKAGLDVEDRRRPQNGKIGVEMGAVTLDIMVAAAGTNQGQRVLLKVVQEATRTNLDELGMSEDVQQRLENLNEGRSGLIIVSGSGGSGVTSTIYSLMRRQDAFMKQLATLEARPAVDLENVTQSSYEDQTQLPDRLSSLMRRDPDVMAIDRCDTGPGAAVIVEAAAAKSMILGMSADSAFKALAKWLKLAGDARAEAVRPLLAVTCQTLLRKLCPTCKEAYRPARDLLARLNLPADRIDKFYRPPTKPLVDEKGVPRICETCRGTGYFGRTGAFEMLELNDEIRELILAGAALNRIRAACRKNKMLYLQEQGLRKVIEGVTSIDEVIRVSKKK